MTKVRVTNTDPRSPVSIYPGDSRVLHLDPLESAVIDQKEVTDAIKLHVDGGRLTLEVVSKGRGNPSPKKLGLRPPTGSAGAEGSTTRAPQIEDSSE